MGNDSIIIPLVSTARVFTKKMKNDSLKQRNTVPYQYVKRRKISSFPKKNKMRVTTRIIFVSLGK